MRKTFSLHAPGKADARVLDAIKHEVRKYVKRERRKTPPEGFDTWQFACKVGITPELAEAVPLPDVSGALDRVAQGGADAVFIELVATPVTHRAGDGLA